MELVFGNHAAAKGAIDAGLKFYAGYPITPSSEIAEELSVELPKVGGIFIQMEDEIGSINACIGAAYADKVSLTATSGPGFALMQEGLGLASMAELPVVIIDVMRGGPSTGLATLVGEGDLLMAIWGTHGDHPVIVVSPGNVKEFYIYTQKALVWAETHRIPVVVLADEVIGHSYQWIDEWPEPIKIPERTKERVLEIFENPDDYLPFATDEEGHIVPLPPIDSGIKWHMTGSAHDVDGFPTIMPEKVKRLIERLWNKVGDIRDELIDYEYLGDGDADILLMSFASMGMSAKQAYLELKEEGYKVALFRPRVLWPFPGDELAEIIKKNGIKKIIIPELNAGQLMLLTKAFLADKGVNVQYVGINHQYGEMISPDEIKEAVYNG
ncbi:MAG: 2-oxoacid:acceptor oxidoreductase subunit alpha [Dictyoglomi bacterium]|nr:2-oxoacid:acceptor oxidoreductase subunit alpha [Dictyoglomota bacterium]